MAFYDDEKEKKTEVDTEDDVYDYLDTLMQDVMGIEEDKSTIASEKVEILEDIDENLSEDLDVNQGLQVNTEKTEEDNEVLESGNSRRRRAPLFQQLGIGSYEKSSDDESSTNENKDSFIDSNEDLNEIEVDEDVSEVSHIDNNSFDKDNGSDSKEGLDSDSDDISITNKDVIRDGLKEETHEVKENFLLANEDSKDSLSDMFDGMLEDLASSLDEDSPIVEEDSDEKSLDDSVEVPLQTKEMTEVKVTPDGRTLAEMIPALRGGARSVDKVVQTIKDQTAVVEVGDKKFSDDRYVKHVKRVKKKRAIQDEKRFLSNKFLQRNAKFTEQEKIIMENLGVNNEQFTALMGAKDLSKKQKEEILALGKYGAEKHFKGRRYRTTVGDSAMLEFLVKFKFANTRILRWISNEPQGRTWRKLNRLRNNGLAESKSLIGIPDLWAATPAGVAISGYDFKPGLRPMPKMITVSSSMGINYIAACLWFNTVNVLNLDDFPAKNRVISLQEDGRDRVRGEMLVSELEIRSSLGKEINPHSTTMKTLGDERLYDVISSNVREEFEKWEEGGRVGDSPEFLAGNEYMWVLYPTSQLTLSYHVPDLVVKRERGPNGEPRSIAVEMERYEKDIHRYDKTMLAYKLDEYLYEQVVWITPNARVARALERSAERVGLTKYSIVPIITETGVYDKQDIWMI